MNFDIILMDTNKTFLYEFSINDRREKASFASEWMINAQQCQRHKFSDLDWIGIAPGATHPFRTQTFLLFLIFILFLFNGWEVIFFFNP